MFFFRKPKPEGAPIAGTGAPGPKTLALLNAKDLIEKHCPPFPFMFPFTPQFYIRYLDTCGAFKAGTSAEARRRILDGSFDAKEMREIARAVHHFIMMDCTSIMVRSDDSPIGTGYRYSGTASVGRKKEEKRLVEIVAHEMKKVLASDFSENAQEFNRMKGIAGNCGVLLMPVYGQVFEKNNYSGEKVVFPLASITYIGKMHFFSKEPNGHMVSAGSGFEWISHLHTLDGITSNGSIEGQLLSHSISPGSALDVSANKLISYNDIESNFSIHEKMMRFLQNNSIYMPEARISGLVGDAGASYIEGISHGKDAESLMIVQYSKFSIPKMERPRDHIVKMVIRVPHEAMTEDSVIGCGVRRTTETRFCDAPAENVDYNKSHKGYLLVMNLRRTTEFKGWLDNLASFSNAAAIIINSQSRGEEVFTHLKGAVRELNIPIIAIARFGMAWEMWEGKALAKGGKFLIYVNEFAPGRPEGFVAKIS